MRGRVLLGAPVVVLALAGITGPVLVPGTPAGAQAAHGEQATVTGHQRGHLFTMASISTTWTQTLNDTGNPVATSSPNVADLDGYPSAVVGDRAGYVYAFHLADGSPVTGWPYHTGAPVDSTPSVAAVNPGGLDSVFVGTGNPASPHSGGYQAISPSGGDQWFVQETDPSYNNYANYGVDSGMSVGNLQGQTDVVSGSMSQEEYAINATSGQVLPGFPWYEADSNFSTPAIADVLGNGENQIIEGGASTAGVSYGTTYSDGGHLRVLLPTGNLAQPEPNGGLVCQYDTDQEVDSSPAVGEFVGGSTVGAVFGTGTYRQGASTTDHLLAVNAANCGLLWNVALDGTTVSSPALADVLGDGGLQVVEGTNVGGNSGTVWVLNGSDGSTIWRAAATGAIIGSITTVDLGGAGYQDLLVPTTFGVDVFDGKTGADLGDLPGTEFDGFQNAPLVTDDPNGTIGITVAGYTSGNQGIVIHDEVGGSTGSGVDEPGAWPMFHHDPQLTGTAPYPGSTGSGSSSGSGGSGAPAVTAMAATSDSMGYWLVDSSGTISNFGDAVAYGALPVPSGDSTIAMAGVPAGSGFWVITASGNVYTEGDATYYGSIGQLDPKAPPGGANAAGLSHPMVGMAVTADGKGYWTIDSGGDIYSFGDATYYGSAGQLNPSEPPAGSNQANLAKPIVGMARTGDGKGYWFVAADGGVFAFGDAGFFGSK